MPTVDVSEKAKGTIVSAEIPGVEAQDIDVNPAGDVLTIKGERKREREEKDESFHGIERSCGSFYRSRRLPSEVDGDKIKASYKKRHSPNLTPKTKKATARKIEVRAG